MPDIDVTRSNNLNHKLPQGSGWVNGVWHNASAPNDFKPTICFMVVTDDYFQVKYRNFRDTKARDVLKRLKEYGEKAIMWDLNQSCWTISLHHYGEAVKMMQQYANYNRGTVL